MAKRSRVITMSPLVLNQEDDLEIDLDLWEVVNPSDGEYSDDSFSVGSLSNDDVISLDDASFVSPSVVSPPPQMLPVADGGEPAADLGLDGHVDDDRDGDEVDGKDLGWAQRRMVLLRGGTSLDDASFVSPSVVSPPPQMLPVTDVGEPAADLGLDGHVDDDRDGDEVAGKDLGWAQRRMVLLRGGTSLYPVGITYGDFVNRGGCFDDGEEDRGADDSEYDDSYDLDEELVPRSVCKKLGRQRMRKLGKRAIAKAFTPKTFPYSYLKPGCVRGKHGLGMKFKC